MIDTECNKANKIAKWLLIGMGLGQVFLFAFFFTQGFVEGLLGL